MIHRRFLLFVVRADVRAVCRYDACPSWRPRVMSGPVWSGMFRCRDVSFPVREAVFVTGRSCCEVVRLLTYM